MNKNVYKKVIWCIVGACVLTLTVWASQVFESFGKSTVYECDISAPCYENINTLLVLSGGGAKAMGHVGALEELEKMGVKPDLIIGVSSGAIVGALYADGLTTKEIKNLLIHKKAKDFIDYNILDITTSLSSNEKLFEFLKANLKSHEFTSLKIPFVAAATNLTTGVQDGLGKGEIIPAVLASASYPGVFKPIKIGDEVFIDGGVTRNLPISLAKKFRPKKIIAVNIGYGIDNTTPQKAIDILLKSIQIMQKNVDDLEKPLADVTIDVDLHDLSTFDGEGNIQAYEKGKKAILEHKKEIKGALNGFGISLG